MSGGHNGVTTPPAHPVFLLCFHLTDPGRDRRARDQNLSATWRRLWRGRGVQGADQSTEGERLTRGWCQSYARHFRLLVKWQIPFSSHSSLLPFTSPPPLWYLYFPYHFLWLCFSLGIHWPLSSFPRRAFPLLWLAPTSWLRWRGRRSVVVSTPGELLKWRTPSTMTSSNCAPCLCESPWQ